MKMEKIALIVAGGTGTRMGNQLPKQFLEVAGRPLLMHTLALFSHFDPSARLLLVLPESHHALWQELCRQYGFNLPHRVIGGGHTRFHSVKNGLETTEGDGIVFIHDGVRPLVSPETLSRCLETALIHGNAIPAVPVSESVRQCDEAFPKGGPSHPVDRSRLVLIQTPQTFRLSLIRQAYQQDDSPEFTDDASVLEKTGTIIRLVEGNRENIKITWPADLRLAEALLKENFLHFQS